MNSGDMIQIEAPDFDPDIDDISPTIIDQEPNNPKQPQIKKLSKEQASDKTTQTKEKEKPL